MVLRADQRRAAFELLQLLDPSAESSKGRRCVTLDGATGTGKTRVLASAIYSLQRPVLILNHNKALVKQNYEAFQGYFPNCDVGLLTSVYSRYIPPRIKTERGTYSYKPGFGTEVQGERERRNSALRLIGDKVPIVDASISAAYPCTLPDVDLRSKLREDQETLHILKARIRAELKDDIIDLQGKGQHAEAERLSDLVLKDLATLDQDCWCPDFVQKYGSLLPPEYSSEKSPIAYFSECYGEEWLLILDESHEMLQQFVRTTTSSKTRQNKMVEEGLRLRSSMATTPTGLSDLFAEGGLAPDRVVFASATPDDRPLKPFGISPPRVRMDQRPTHILDPELEEVQLATPKAEGEFMAGRMHAEILDELAHKRQVLACCSTKHDVRNMTNLLKEMGVCADYITHARAVPERERVVQGFREGRFGVLCGVCLLREGLDFPRVGLVYIFNADCGGFLRSETALVQFIGRAARSPNGRVVMAYTKRVSEAMVQAGSSTRERREAQIAYNSKHGYQPEELSSMDDVQQRPWVRGRSARSLARSRSLSIDADALSIDEEALAACFHMGPKRAKQLIRPFGSLEHLELELGKNRGLRFPGISRKRVQESLAFAYAQRCLICKRGGIIRTRAL